MGKGLLSRSRHGGKDHIKIWVENLDETNAEQDVMVGFCEHGNEPAVSIKRHGIP
jgi:hypothetical protein